MDTKHRRLIHLDRLLRGKAHLTLAEIQGALHDVGFGKVSERTFYNDRRDLEFFTDSKITCSQASGEHRYTYADPNPKRLEDFVHIEEHHMRALYLARDALENTQGIPESEDISDAIQNLEDMISDAGQPVFRPRVDKVVQFARSPMKPVDPEVWRAVYDAVETQCKLTLFYQKGWNKDGDVERKTVLPIRIINLQGEWYLLANKDSKEEAVRQFHLSRVISAEKKKPFAYLPDGLDIDAYLANNFGRFIGDPYTLVQVKLRFSPKVYPIVSGHRYHPKQRAEQLEDGGLELSFPVTAFGVDPSWRFYHVRSWILSFGEDCEVVEPQELKELVKGDLERALARCKARL